MVGRRGRGEGEGGGGGGGGGEKGEGGMRGRGRRGQGEEVEGVRAGKRGKDIGYGCGQDPWLWYNIYMTIASHNQKI